MRTPKMIKVIASRPRPGQDPIDWLIGTSIKVERGQYDPKDKTCTVVVSDNKVYNLNPDEYEVLER